MTRPVKREVERKCEQCGGIFLVSKGNHLKIFCSQECANKNHNRKKVEKLKIKECPECGHNFNK